MKTNIASTPIQRALRRFCLLSLLLTGFEAVAQVTLDSFSAGIRGGSSSTSSQDASTGLHATVSQNGGTATQDTTVLAEPGRLSVTSRTSITGTPPPTGNADTDTGLSVHFTVTESLPLTLRGTVYEEGRASYISFRLTESLAGEIFMAPRVIDVPVSFDITITLNPGVYQLEATAYGELSSSHTSGNHSTWDFTFKLGKPAPVVFLHGIAGSVLKAGDDQLWPSIQAADVEDLALSPASPPAEAVDVVRKFYYGPFLTHMVDDLGYLEYNLEGDRSRLTSSHMLAAPAEAKPTLFPFPYDWRLSNAAHTATLHQYIQRIRQLHNNAKVNIVAHSMGGLVARRYLLDYGTDNVDKVVTVGSPLLGAVKPIYLLQTGEFYDNLLDITNGDEMKTSLATMPGLHELLASPLYLSNAVSPVFGEAGFDLNRNGNAHESYSTSQFYTMTDALVAPVAPPSQTNQALHNHLAGRQDDWSADTGQVKFLHFAGIQQVKKTIVKVLATSVVEEPLIGAPRQSLKFIAIPGEGDGTVPILSARRLPQYLAPGAIVREIHEPNLGVDSDDQPPGRSAEHTGLMSNTAVWDGITEFLATGTLAPAVMAPAAPIPTLARGAPFPAPGDPPEIEVEEPSGATLEDGMANKAFGTVDLGSSSTVATYRIRNTGGSDLTGLSVTKEGPHEGDFMVGGLGSATVLPGESTSFTVTFSPTAAGGNRGGLRTAAIRIISNDADESPFNINLTGQVTPGRKKVHLAGAGYIQFRDALGNTNARLSSIVAQRVPGVDVQYGGSQPWVDLTFSADKQLTLGSVLSGDLFDLTVTEFDSAGTAFSRQRYRLAPDGHSWQAVVAPGQLPDLKVDGDNDMNFAPGEAVIPVYNSTGGPVDTTPPTIMLILADGPDGIQLTLSGSDGMQPPPVVRHSVDGGPAITYSLPLVFPETAEHTVKAFSRDASGNTSGMIETTINPRIGVGIGPEGSIQVQWPATDGWVLEESTALSGPWSASAASLRAGPLNQVLIPRGSDALKFFRLRSTPVMR